MTPTELQTIRNRAKTEATNPAMTPWFITDIRALLAHLDDREAKLAHAHGIIARNTKTRLAGEDGPLFITGQDIADSLEILYAEIESGHIKNA